MAGQLKEIGALKAEGSKIQPRTVGGRLDQRLENNRSVVSGVGSGIALELTRQLLLIPGNKVAGMENGDNTEAYMKKAEGLKKSVIEDGVLSPNDITIVKPGELSKYQVNWAVYKGTETGDPEPILASKVQYKGKEKGEPFLQILPVNVANHAQVNQSMNEIWSSMDGADNLFPVAGIQKSKGFEKMSDPQIIDIFKVNIMGVSNLIKEVIPTMKEQKEGSIVLMGSVNRGDDGTAWYSLTKIGQEAIADSMNKQLLREKFKNIKLAVVAPTFVETPLVTDLDKDVQEAIKKKLPTQEFIKPVDVVDNILFVAKDLHQRKVVHVDDGYVV